MKILFIINNLQVGGAEKLNYELLQELSQDDNYECKLILLMRGKDFDLQQLGKVEILEFNYENLKPLNIFKSILRCRKFIKSFKPAIIVSSNSRSNLIAAVAGFKNKAITVLWEHCLISLYLNIFVKIAYLLSDKVITVSNTAKNDLVENLKIPENKITVIYNFVDFNNINKYQKQSYELKNATAKIVSVGALSERKDYKTALKVAKILSDRQITFQYFILGRGEEKEELEKLVKDYGLSDKIIFKGILSDLYEFMSSCDIYLNTSRWETFGLSVVEALSIGLPVVSCDRTGVYEVIEENKYGFFAERENLEKLADHVEFLINNQEEREKFGINGLTRAQQFDKEIFIEAFKNYISNL